MSNAFEKVIGLSQIPIFPLPLVLLPNELLPLHIFEPRYRRMLADAEAERNLIGISYFEPEDEFSDKPPIGSVGCVAEVKESQLMADGRSNILTIGVIRYQLVEYVDSGTPYLTAKVEFFEDTEEDASVLDPAADVVFELFERVAKAAFKLSGNRGNFPEIERTEPERLTFLVMAAFNLEIKMKYQFLEMVSTSERLSQLRLILIQAVATMEESADVQESSKTNGHVSKKIDL